MDIPKLPNQNPGSRSFIDTIINYLAEQARIHGLAMVLLGAAVWYFHGENLKMAEDIKSCHQDVISIYREDRIRMMEIIQNNTEALRRINDSQPK